jgi:surface antigen
MRRGRPARLPFRHEGTAEPPTGPQRGTSWVPDVGPRRGAAARLRRGVAVLAVVPPLLAGTLPAAETGQFPLPVRRPAADAVLSVAGPAATAYPYRTGALPTLDAFGFVTGECTSFAAWWLNSHGVPLGVMTIGSGGVGWFLNASSWDTAARAAGYAVGSQPVVGAVAQFDAGEQYLRHDPDGVWRMGSAGDSGHVGVVTRVLPGGEVEWLDYGSGGRAELHQGRGFAPRYLYLGVEPPPAAS